LDVLLWVDSEALKVTGWRGLGRWDLDLRGVSQRWRLISCLEGRSRLFITVGGGIGLTRHGRRWRQFRTKLGARLVIVGEGD
jgi:hypothetical protein